MPPRGPRPAGRLRLAALERTLAGQLSAAPDGPSPEWRERYAEYVALGFPAGAPIPGRCADHLVARRGADGAPTVDLSLFFAGTAGSVPTARRGLPALLLRAGGDRLLFDCGEGTQQQLLRSVGLPELDASS